MSENIRSESSNSEMTDRRLKIIYFTQFYSPEPIAAAFRATEHAELWAAEDNDVTVFTSWPNYPTGRLFDGYEIERLGEEEVGCVRVLRSGSSLRPNTSLLKRVHSGLSLIVNGLRNLRRHSSVGSDYDVCLVTCGTVFFAWLGVHWARRNGIPFVVEFRDLTWRQLMATGFSEDDFKVRAVRRLELSLCEGAARVVVLTEGFRRDLVAEGVPASSIEVVPNGADIVDCHHSFRSPLRLGYFGTIGLSQDVPRTLRYASALAAERLVASYTVVGNGAARDEAVSASSSCPDGLVTFLGGMPKDDLESLYASVDMTVVSLRKDSAFEGTVPSKIFQSLARGVPVLYIGPKGDAAEIVKASGGGVALCGDEEADLSDLKAFVSQHDILDVLAKMSASAVSYMGAYYTRAIMANRLLAVLKGVADQNKENKS